MNRKEYKERKQLNDFVRSALGIEDSTKEKTAEYDDYLNTEHWQQLSEETKRLAGYRCQVCNSEGELHAHHRTYERKGDELQSDLICLCNECHNLFHSKDRIKKVLELNVSEAYLEELEREKKLTMTYRIRLSKIISDVSMFYRNGDVVEIPKELSRTITDASNFIKAMTQLEIAQQSMQKEEVTTNQD
jgi:hypothetical protein